MNIILLSVPNFAALWLIGAGALALSLLLVYVIRILTRTKDPELRAKYAMWSNDPANWKVGVFYFNPSDHRLFPPKRIAATGWTVNFANPLSVIALVILIGIIIVASFFLKK